MSILAIILFVILVAILTIILVSFSVPPTSKMQKIKNVLLENRLDTIIKQPLEKRVELKLVNGESYDVDYKSYEDINDPIRQNQYRIHRSAIVSERHYTFLNYHNDEIGTIKVYGKENGIMERAELWNTTRKDLNIRYIKWHFKNGKLDYAEVMTYSSWSIVKVDFK